MPAHAAVYGVPGEWRERGISRYGFHGASHQYVSERAAEMLGRPASGLRLVSCHLGGSSSICAIDRGRSVDTTMGFSPQSGLENATRHGDLDVFAALFMMERHGWTTEEVRRQLAGLGGLAGISCIAGGDVRDIEAAALQGDRNAALALKVFAYQVKKTIGAYAAALGGADVIAFAIPRQFALPEDEVLRYCETVAKAVTIPVFVQDFNPGGVTVGADFAARLLEAADNFRYLKLEEPMMGAKIRAVRKATRDQIGLFEGWGGMYLLELIRDGISGAVPGLAMCDLFVRVFDLASQGKLTAAMTIYRSMLPQIVFCLQSMELFHHCEKRLLRARGLLTSTVVRNPTFHLDAHTEAHIDFLNDMVLAELKTQDSGVRSQESEFGFHA
jgi:dihydrodipicolinate synthase/N-acetylneuraminate lyase